MAIGNFKQDPTARLDYPIDWSQYLEAGDSIATSTARLEPDGQSGIAVDDVVVISGNVTTVWVNTTGAAPGPYTVTVHVVTTAGREDERSIKITAQDQ